MAELAEKMGRTENITAQPDDDDWEDEDEGQASAFQPMKNNTPPNKSKIPGGVNIFSLQGKVSER